MNYVGALGTMYMCEDTYYKRVIFYVLPLLDQIIYRLDQIISKNKR